MEWDRIETNWKHYIDNARKQWGRITADELDIIGGRRDTLAGQIQEVYNISKDEALKQVEAWRGLQIEIA